MKNDKTNVSLGHACVAERSKTDPKKLSNFAFFLCLTDSLEIDQKACGYRTEQIEKLEMRIGANEECV